MKKRKNARRFKNSFLANKIPVIIAVLLLVTLLSFLILYNNYKEAFVIDIDGYMIGNDNLDQLKLQKDPEEETEVTRVNVKSEESIMKNSFDHYIANGDKQTVNVDYPLYVNDGLTIINYNDNTNLLNKDFERTTGLPNSVLSYGKLYDNVTYTQIDQEAYLFLSYQDGILINLYDIKIETIANTYIIPVNSFVYFFENQLNYLKREEDGFVKGKIQDVDLDSKVTFYYLGGDESYEYTYEEVITLTGSVYIQEELPPVEITPEPEPEPEPEPKPEKPTKPRPQRPVQPERPVQPPAEKYWAKPTVTSTPLKEQVYSLEGKITINDPAGVIVKEPTYTLYINSKVSTRRTYYQTSDVIISGLSAETEYVVIGTYTYVDSDWETKKIVTFFVETYHTKERTNLEKIDVSFGLGKIYPRKMELKNLQITSSLNSEAMRGVKKVGIRVSEETFILNTSLTQSLLKGERVTVTSTDILKSNKVVNFTILFFDKDNNIIEAINNQGTTKTCKQQPTLFLKIIKNDNINMTVSLDLRNDDDVKLQNYRYILINNSKDIIQSGRVEGDEVEVTNLDPDRVFTLRVYADMDLEDGNGTIQDIMLKDINLVTLPISSLGYIHLKPSATDVTSTSATVKVEMNHNRTDSRLVKLLKSLTMNVYDIETNALIYTEVIDGEDLQGLKDRKSKTIVLKNLESFNEYRVEFTSLVTQGNTNYNLECIYSLDPIYTRKPIPIVNITHMFVNEEMIDFDINITDPKNAILTEEVVVELRDKKNKLVNTTIVKTNNGLYRITYSNLEKNQQYTINIYADEYNETHLQYDYKSKYLLYSLTKTTRSGISGSISPVSSERKTTGKNIIDVSSEIKWYQTEQTYTIPKTVDESNNLHIYSKNSNSDYAYDLSEYEGKRVTVTFTIRSLTPHLTNRKVYVKNYLNGTTTRAYEDITNNTSAPKSVTYTFRVGAIRDSDTDKDAGNTVCTSVLNGKNRCSYFGFYITGGDSERAEYVIENLMAYVSEDEYEYETDIELVQGMYNTNGVEQVSALDVRTGSRLQLEAGYSYQFNYNTEKAYIYFFQAGKTAAVKKLENVVSGQTYRPTTDMTAVVFMRNPSSPDPLKPEQVTLEVKKMKPSTTATFYQPFEYKLETKVKVNLTDLYSEIYNDRYFVRVYEDGQELTCPNNPEETTVVGERAPCYIFQGTTDVVDKIHEIDLKEKKNYVVELAVYINERFYTLSNFEISTNNEVKGISTIEDWSSIQPRGHYILLNDLSLAKYYGEKIGYGYRYFYGEIDFQGYTLSTYSSSTNGSDPRGLELFSRIERSAVLKNLVLEVHLDQEFRTTDYTGFVRSNYGTIENVIINLIDETTENLENTKISPLIYENKVSGVVRNFIVNVVNETSLYYNSSLLVRDNYGLIENGYIYGENILVDPLYTDTASAIGLIQVYGGTRSTVRNVYVLPNLVHSTESQLIGGLIAYETYGKIEDAYTIGDSNGNKMGNGPAVGQVRATADLRNVFYYNKKVYTNEYQQKTTATALNDVSFQESILGDAFNVEDLVKIGYYPHVKFTTTKMPPQPYIELPVVNDKKNVDIVSMKVIDQTTSTATVEFSISNPEAAQITDIVISDLDCTIKFQRYEEGTTILTATLSNPEKYLSKYSIMSISTTSAGYDSTRDYTNGEKYANVSLYKEIYTVADWKVMATKNDQNFALMNDLSFFGQSDYYIDTFNGTLDGRGHTISDITVNKSGMYGVFNNYYGTLKNITFKDIKKATDTAYSGIIGYSNEYAVFDNVHVNNIEITIPEETTRTTIYVGGLVGYSKTSKFQNCSVSNPKITSTAATSGIGIGGMIGRALGGIITNSFVRNINIKVEKSIGVNGIGGLIGRAEDNAGDTSILYTYTTGTIVNNNIYTGGIVGVNYGVVEHSYSTINLSGDLGYVGGIIGFTNSSAGSHVYNLFLGNIYTPKNGTKIVPNIEVGATNFSLDGSLVNGVQSSLTYGESTIKRADLYKAETYDETINLGEFYDYSKSSEGVLPKLYDTTGTTILPNQDEDFKIPSEQINITELTVKYERNDQYIANSAAVATLTFDALPEGYEIIGATVEGGTNLKVNQTGPTTATIYFEPERYYDYYKLSALEVSVNGTPETQEKQNIISIQFFKRITSIEEWNSIDSNYPENYNLATDIDLSAASVKTNIIVNRIIGETKVNPLDETDTKYSIYNYTEEYKTNRTGVCIFEKIISKISNVKFKDISITDKSTGANSFVNIIRYNYGEMDNIDFKNITLNAYYEEYVGPVGVNYGQEVHDINLDEIYIDGKDTVAGFIAYAENGEERKYYNIHGKNLDVRAMNHRVGGIFGAMRVVNDLAHYLIHDISVDSSKIEAAASTGTYVGGITGYGDCTRYCTISNTEILGSRYVGGIAGYQLSVYSRDLEAYKVTITGRTSSAYYVGGLYGYARRVYTSYVVDSTITFNNSAAYGLGGIVGYMGSYYYIKSTGVTDSTLGNGLGKEIGGLSGRHSSGEIYNSYVQDCIISGNSMVGGIDGTLRGGWSLRNHVTRTSVTADTYAGGMVGQLGSTETSHGYIREIYATDMTVYAKNYAGGLFGGLKYALYYPYYVYSLYYEGSITSETPNSAGLATGDEFNNDILPLNRIVFYENTTVNSVKAFTYGVPPTIDKTKNMLGSGELVEGYYLGSKGEQYYNRSYPNAAYVADYIKLEGGKTYTVGVNVKSGYDWFRVKLYDLDGTFNKDLSDSTPATNYYPRTYNFTRQNQVTFKIFRDCYIRVMFYDKGAIEGYYLYETTYGNNNVNSEQLVDYNDLTNKVTWARYANETTGYDNLYSTKLNFENTYYDFTRIDNEINGEITSTTMPTADGNKTVAVTGTVTALQKEGIMFDGYDDSVTIGSEFKQPVKDFTVSVRIKPISNTEKNYQFLYFAGSTNVASRAFGIALHSSNGRRLYVLINGSYLATDIYIPRKVTSEITVTFAKNATGTKYTLRVYVNGEQRYIKEDIGSSLLLGDLPVTQISPPKYTNSTTNARYYGFYERLLVYDTVLPGTLIKNGYNTDSWVSENLLLKYDFRSLDSSRYYNSSSSYPTLVDSSIKVNDVATVQKYQEVLPLEYDPEQKNRLTPLPYAELNNRTYFNLLNNQFSSETTSMFTTEQLGAKINILDRAISDIYKVYPSSHNTVNIEFNKIYSDVKFKYANGDYESNYQRLDNRVYTLSYDYKNDLIITIKSATEDEEITLTSKDLARTVQIINNNYYHIENNKLYKNDKKIADKAYTIYNNIVLLDNNKIYDLINEQTLTIEPSIGFKVQEIPIAEYNVQDRKVETFYNFSRITDLDGNVAIRTGQIHVRDEKIYIFDSNLDAEQDMNVYNTYNTEEYQISLIDGHLISIKSGINLPAYFNNNNITEVEQDTNSKDSIVIVRYKNGYVVAFDYYTGEELFTYGTKEKISLISYIGSSVSGEYVLSSSNNTYKESNTLKETLTNITDQEVKDKLSSPLSKPKPPVSLPDDESNNSGEPGTKIPTSTVTNDFVQVYNTTTGEYEVYSTNDILNAGNTTVENTSMKITKDVFLYNYFQGEKKNTFFEKTKLAIIAIIIGLVIINLILFIKNINTKEVKHEKVKTN